ncbi:MAG: PG0541 family transporter-associated protein [Burkholderiales bacterium]
MMKMALVVCNTFFIEQAMKALKDNHIDYFTRWDNALGKGHGTEPHLGTGTYASTNSVIMIAFEEEAPLEALIRGIQEENKSIQRAADRIRLFQLPMDRIV